MCHIAISFMFGAISKHNCEININYVGKKSSNQSIHQYLYMSSIQRTLYVFTLTMVECCDKVETMHNQINSYVHWMCEVFTSFFKWFSSYNGRRHTILLLQQYVTITEMSRSVLWLKLLVLQWTYLKEYCFSTLG